MNRVLAIRNIRTRELGDGISPGVGVDLDVVSLTPRDVIYSGPATVVLWDDGTKTVVKCAEGDVYDPTKAYLEAFYRKATGWSKSRCRRELGRITSDAGARDVRGI